MQIKYVLKSLSNKESIVENTYSKFPLNSSVKELNNNDLNSILNLSERFDYERQNNLNFKLYGTINYISVLNNINSLYNEKSDFFKKANPISFFIKNLLNSFEFHIVKPSLFKTDITGTDYTQLIYDVITNLNEIDIVKNNLSKNIFSDEIYNFFVKKTINLNNIVDFSGKPVSSLFLYAKYMPKDLGIQDEKLFVTVYDASLNYSLTQISPLPTFSSGDTLNGDIYIYSESDYLETKVRDIKYIIECNYNDGNEIKQLRFIYSPFIEIKLREYSVNENILNTGNTYNVTYPLFAKHIDNNGNIKWNNILDFGYIESTSNRGIDFPFLNNNHYVYKNINLSVQPDLTHENTALVFAEMMAVYNDIQTSLNNSIDNSSDSNIC